MKTTIKTITFLFTLALAGSIAGAQQPTAAERVVALKANLAASQALLKPYEWIETTTVSLKGEEKSQQQERCYHGADGKIQKVPVTAPPPEDKKRGLRGKIVERKKEEMSDYMKEAVALVKQYMPPDQARIQAAKDAGKVSISPQPNQRVRLTFADYLKAGDSLVLDVDLASNRPVSAKVSSFLDSDKEPVTLDVQFGTLDNNATYTAATILNATGKSLSVKVENTGYRKMTP